MKPKEIILEYKISGSEHDRKSVEVYFNTLFESFFTSQSGTTAKQEKLKTAYLAYCFSSIDKFVEQYHTNENAKDVDSFFLNVTKNFSKKISTKKKEAPQVSVEKKTVKPKEKPHYVSNRDFSNAVVEYCTEVREAKSSEKSVPVVPDYIASCFLKIAEGLSHKGNFVRYTYREEMVMDAVENMLKAIENYNIEAATRSGKPNAFAYFTQISWFAFLRRIEKEKKQQNIKLKYIAEADVMDFLAESLEEDGYTAQQASPFIDSLRMRIDAVKSADHEFKEYVKEEKQRRRRAVNVDSDLSEWMED